LNSIDIRSVRAGLENNEQNLPDLTASFLQKISAENADINAFTSLDEESALAKAERIQNKIQQGSAGKLAGAVIGIKEIICQKDRKTTCGSRMLSGFESVYNATVVDRLETEDALIIGRLNMDEFAMGSSTENSFHGITRNPHNTSRVPGGSSGGSAAAVAAGFCNATLGSDTGGSIRQPAAFCGVTGLKPGYGRVSRHGLVAFASSFDCIGPLASTVYDTALILEVIAGKDPKDSTSSSRPVEPYTKFIGETEKNLKVGLPDEYLGEGLDPEIRARVEWIADKLQDNGAEIVPIHLPHTRYAIATYYVLATAEASSNLARYDGIRYGHRADIKKIREKLREDEKRIRATYNGETSDQLRNELSKLDTPLIRLYKQSRTEGFGTEVKRRIMLGTYVLSAGYYEAYFGKAQKIRRLIQQDFMNAFSKVDVILSPATPTTAFEIGSNPDDPLQMYLNDIYTISANLAGICAISVPAGRHSDGLPVGVQFMGNIGDEGKILNAAARVELMSIQ
jgi:aspartyl-tRNA(Asn)/glutamyl-tRNA(Gln) amidotransferase subunit A